MTGLLIAATSVLLGAPDDQMGRAVSFEGDVRITHWREDAPEAPLVPGEKVFEGDLIRTGDNSRARVLLSNSSVVSIGSNAEVTMTQRKGKVTRKRTMGVKVALGRIWARVSSFFGSESSFEVTTPNAVAGVRGTSFFVDVDEDGNAVFSVLRGRVRLVHERGSTLDLGALQQLSSAGQGFGDVKTVPTSMLGDLASGTETGVELDSGDSGTRLNTLGNTMDGKGRPDGGETQGRAQGMRSSRGRMGRGAITPPADIDPGQLPARVRGRIRVVRPDGN